MICQRNAEVVKRKIAGEVFLVPVRNNLADMRNVYVLHGIAEFIWESLAEPVDSDAICGRIVDRFEVDPESARRDLDTHLAELISADLVHEAGGE